MHITDPFKLLVFLIMFGVLVMVCEPDACKYFPDSDGCTGGYTENGYPQIFQDGTLLIEKRGVFIVNGELQYGPSSENNTWSAEDNLNALKKIQSGD